MSTNYDRLHLALADLQAELDELGPVEPQLRQRLEGTLADLRTALDQSDAADAHPGFAQRLTETARHFEETHPNLAGMIGSVIDALGRMGI